MNNSQAALIAAAAFHSGQQASTQDVYQTAKGFEQHLKQQDVQEAYSDDIAREVVNPAGSFERLVPPAARGGH